MSQAGVPATKPPILPPNIRPDKIEEVFQDNFDVIRFGDLERVGVPSGGGESWKVDAIDGVRYEKALVGVIVHWNVTRSYFRSKEAQHVDCWSPDGKRGIGEPGGNCEICPKAMFIDDAPAECKEQRSIYLLTSDGILPYHLMLPPTSLAPFRKFMVRLSSRQMSYYEVQVEFTLKDDRNKAGQVYSVLQIKPIRQLDPEEVKIVKNYRYSLERRLKRDFSQDGEELEEPGETVQAEGAPEDDIPDFKEPTTEEIDEHIRQELDGIPDEPLGRFDAEDPGNVQYNTGPKDPEPPAPVVDPAISNDEFLAGLDWDDLVNEKKKDPAVFALFTTALSTRFYARMSKKGKPKDEAKTWLLDVCGLPGADISTKDVLGEPDLIRLVNMAFWEKYKELLFLQVQ